MFCQKLRIILVNKRKVTKLIYWYLRLLQIEMQWSSLRNMTLFCAIPPEECRKFVRHICNLPANYHTRMHTIAAKHSQPRWKICPPCESACVSRLTCSQKDLLNTVIGASGDDKNRSRANKTEGSWSLGIHHEFNLIVAALSHTVFKKMHLFNWSTCADFISYSRISYHSHCCVGVSISSPISHIFKSLQISSRFSQPKTVANPWPFQEWHQL